MDAHAKFYEKKDVVKYFNKKETIFPGEFYFIMKNKEWLKNCSMLDIGVGAGRSTFFFAPIVKKYTALDLSSLMIDMCNKKFKNVNGELNFIVGDALNLPFEDKSLDFVLFSYNGIDVLSAENRIKCLNEMKRVLKDDGVLLFSSFNLKHISYFYKLKFYKNPKKMLSEMLRVIKVNKVNGPLKKILKSTDYTMFTGGSTHNFNDIKLGELKHHYVSPAFQLKQLESLGFKNITIYSSQIVSELDVNAASGANEWLFYYSCVN